MENNEMLVVDSATENASAGAEGTANAVPEKRYSEADFNAAVNDAVGKRNARYKAKLDKEYAEKGKEYDELMSVLRAGSKKEGASVSEMTETFRKFCKDNDVDVPERATRAELSEADTAILGRHDADEIIRIGYDEAIEEANRLGALGDKLSAREKETLKRLSDHLAAAKTKEELKKLGVSDEVAGSEDFETFKNQFKSDTPLAKVVELYNKINNQPAPKKDIKTAGSLKPTFTGKTGEVKEYYTPEEAKQISLAEIRASPLIAQKIRASMTKWSK